MERVTIVFADHSRKVIKKCDSHWYSDGTVTIHYGYGRAETFRDVVAVGTFEDFGIDSDPRERLTEIDTGTGRGPETHDPARNRGE